MATPKMFDLSGKVAAITGGHSGLGKAISEGFAEAGANLVIAARRCELCQQVCKEISDTYNVKCLPLKCDVTDTAQTINLIETTVREFGKIDILVNSAGVGGSEKPVVEMTDEDWDSTVNVDLRGAFLCSRAAAKEMIKQKSGKIINIASMAGITASKNMAAYCASKAGLVHLSRVMALELARYNVQVNSICPGYFATPMNYDFFSSEPGKKLIEKFMPLRRLGDMEEIKGAAIYLASPASNFSIGAAIVVDGGQSIW